MFHVRSSLCRRFCSAHLHYTHSSIGPHSGELTVYGPSGLLKGEKDDEKKTTVLYGPSHKTTVLYGPANGTTVLYGPAKDTSVIYGPAHDTTVLYGPAKDTAGGALLQGTANPAEGTSVLYGPAQHTTTHHGMYGPAASLANEGVPSMDEYFHVMIFVPLPYTGEGPKLLSIDPNQHSEVSLFHTTWSPSIGFGGGWSNPAPAGPEQQLLLDAVKPALEQRFPCHFGELRAVSYISQVVAGTNYVMKVKNTFSPSDSSGK